MKNRTTKLMIAAAAFMAVAGVASAQTQIMEAKIPFAFRASGKVLEAGSYRVTLERSNAGFPLIVINGREPGQHVLALPYSQGDAKKDWMSNGDAVLSFECGVGRCSLHEIWMGGNSSPSYRLSVPKLGKDEARKMAEIVMHPAKGD